MSIFNRSRQSESETSTPPQAPRPVAPQQPIGFETVIGTNCSIEGKFISSGNVRLDGVFSGTLEITGNVLVGETAKIEADINAHNISIAGAVRGNVHGNKVQLLRTGRIWGDISATALTTEEGAFIDGKITMRGHEATQSTQDETPGELETPTVAESLAEPAAITPDVEVSPVQEIPPENEDTTTPSSDSSEEEKHDD